MHNLASVDISNTVRHTIQSVLIICCVWIGVHLLHDPHLMRHHVTSKVPTMFVVVIDIAAFTDRVLAFSTNKKSRRTFALCHSIRILYAA